MSELHYLDLGSGQTRRVAGQMGEVHYVAPGWLASVADSILTVRAFDARSMSLSGAPIVLASGVVADELRGTAHVSFGREAGSSAVYLQAPPAPMRQLAWMDAEGQATTPIGEPARLRLIAPSPDGRRAIVGIETQERAPLPQLWMMDLSTGVRAPFTAAGEGGVSVAWSPDGRRVAYRADDGRAVVRPTDGGSDRVILGDPLDNNSPSAWTPDGMSVVMGIYRGLRGTDLAVMPADGQGAPRYLTESPALEMAGAISRDGRWLAYLSNESGRFEVYLTAFGVAGPRWVLTTAGAQDFAWSADRAITYRAPDGRIAQVSWQFQGDRVEVAPARPVLGARDLADAVLALAPTSGRYLVAQPLPGQPLRRSLVLATNWQAEISRPSR